MDDPTVGPLQIFLVSFLEPTLSKRNSEIFVYSYTDGSSAVQYHNSHGWRSFDK